METEKSNKKCENDVCDTDDNVAEGYEDKHASSSSSLSKTPFWIENPNILFELNKILSGISTNPTTFFRVAITFRV